MSESPAVPSPASASGPATATASAAATPTPTPPPVPAVPAVQPTAPSPAPAAAAPTAPPVQAPLPTPVPAPAPVAAPQPVTVQAPSPAVASPAPTPPTPSPVVTPVTTAVPTPAQAPSPAAASPAPQAPALSQATINQLAIFYASQHHQQALAAYNAKPTGNPPQPMSHQQAQQLFLRLPPQQQRQVQATFIARQRIAAQQATQAPPRPPASPAPAPAPAATTYHPSLLGSGGATTPTAPAQPTQPPPAPQPQARPPPAPQPASVPAPAPAAPAPARQRTAASQSKSKQQSNPRTVSFVPTQDEAETGGDRSRRREEGFRGTMRGEIATLMYAAGDVKEPDVDSVDFVEDMVVEFLADLCRPVPPIRTAPHATHTAVPLSADTLRHRLASQPYLRKYLERWDDMTYMWQELQASRRVAQPNHQDLIADLGKQFLGLDEQDGPAAKRRAVEGADGEPKRRGRPPKNPEERKKPGPKKGWKKNLDPNAPPKKRTARAGYKKRDRASASIAPPSPNKTSTPAP